MMDVLSTADKINSALLLVTAIGVLVTALGVIAAFVQIRAGTRAQRASFLKDRYMQLRTDVDVSAAFHLIEYSQFVYTSSFHGSEIEPKVDRLPTLFDRV